MQLRIWPCEVGWIFHLVVVVVVVVAAAACLGADLIAVVNNAGDNETDIGISACEKCD